MNTPKKSPLASAAVTALLLAGILILLISIALPSYRRYVRSTSGGRLPCPSNLRQIGQAILLYSMENNRAYPPDLATLLITQDISPDVFICPDGGDTIAKGRTKQEQAQELMKPGHCSYIYVGAGHVEPIDPNSIVVYEPIKNHGEGMNALYGDGHVDWLDKPRAEAALRDLQQPVHPK